MLDFVNSLFLITLLINPPNEIQANVNNKTPKKEKIKLTQYPAERKPDRFSMENGDVKISND